MEANKQLRCKTKNLAYYFSNEKTDTQKTEVTDSKLQTILLLSSFL